MPEKKPEVTFQEAITNLLKTAQILVEYRNYYNSYDKTDLATTIDELAKSILENAKTMLNLYDELDVPVSVGSNTN